MNKQHQAILFAAILIGIVGVNLFVFLSRLYDISGSVGVFTGFATYQCKEVAGGVLCSNGMKILLKPDMQPCPPGTVEICTNLCKIDKVFSGDNRTCPSTCSPYCVDVRFVHLFK